jgi:cytochrome P450
MLHLCRLYEWRTFSIKWFGEKRMHVTTDPACVEHVLKTAFTRYPKGERFNSTLADLLGGGIFAVDGPAWKSQRQLMSHVFSDKSFRTVILDAFTSHMQTMRLILDEAAVQREPLDIQNLFHRFTLDSIGKIAFGVSLNSLQDPNQAFVAAFDAAQAAIDLRFFTPGWRLCARRRSCFRSEAILDVSILILREFTNDIIAKRRAAGDWAARSDVLSRAMAAVDESTGRPLYRDNDAALRDIILSFMIAGRDTTAQALSWACLNVARVDSDSPSSPSLASALAAEARSAGADAPQWIPTYEDITQNLRLTKATFLETLRLFPSVPKEWKEAAVRDKLPDGTIIGAGDVLVYLPYAMGRRPDLWGEDADAFKPQRFLDAPIVSPYKFTAFNAGPRACLGQNMAIVEACFVMAAIYSRYELSLDPVDQIVEPADSLTLPQKIGAKMKISFRQSR